MTADTNMTGREESTAAMAKLRELHTKQAVLIEQLDRSVALRAFYPDAFKYGSCTTYPRGNPNRPKEMKFVLKDGEGMIMEWPLLEVPRELWNRWVADFRSQTTATGVQWK